MGNRSLLFTADSVPTADHRPDPIRPLAEWNGLPLVHLILASAEPRRCQSLIWRDQAIGIAGDYAAGVERLFGFLGAFAKLGTLPRDRGFAAARAEAELVLASDKHRGRYLLLETGDTFGGPQGDLVPAVERLIARGYPRDPAGDRRDHRRTTASVGAAPGGWLAQAARARVERRPLLRRFLTLPAADHARHHET